MTEITRMSQISGKCHTLEVPISWPDFVTGYNKHKRGVFIQDAFPNLAPEYREFIKTGITPDEWNEMFGEEEE